MTFRVHHTRPDSALTNGQLKAEAAALFSGQLFFHHLPRPGSLSPPCSTRSKAQFGQSPVFTIPYAVCRPLRFRASCASCVQFPWTAQTVRLLFSAFVETTSTHTLLFRAWLNTSF